MKYIDEYRDGTTAQALAAKIKAEANPDRSYHIMEFCGGHTHAISRYGLEDILPINVRMVHGPGCPVCVLPIGRLDGAIWLAAQPDVILCTYGDMMRVPGSKRVSLLKAKASGADIRMVYSTQDALKLAQDNPSKKIVFFAIGFETTTPPTAIALVQAKAMGLNNFFVYCNHVLTPAAINQILACEEVEQGLVKVDGFIGPAHVSTVIGSAPYEPFTQKFKRPVVIAGFEPLDVLQAILMLVRQLNDGRHVVENEFIRAVAKDGNIKAKELMARVFKIRDAFEWRGLGVMADSALELADEFADMDAEKVWDIPLASVADNPACECGAILRGLKRPQECKLFGKVCTPENPMGSCMVSAEGACAAYWTFGRFREQA